MSKDYQWIPYSHAGCLGRHVDGVNIIEDKSKGGYWYRESKSMLAGVIFWGALAGLAYATYKAITTPDDGYDNV